MIGVPAVFDRFRTFLEVLSGAIAVLLALALRLWYPGIGKSLADTTKRDWILVGAIFGTLALVIGLAFALR